MSAIALIKILTIPFLIGMVTVIAKRFGALIGGIVAGLPLISAPIAYFIAQEQGAAFAIQTAWGAYPGMLAFMVFGLAFAHGAMRWHWAVALLVALVIFFVASFVMVSVPIAKEIWLALAAVGIWVTPKCLPTLSAQQLNTKPQQRPPYIQMTCGAILMVIITALAQVVGPTLSGILLFFPVIGGTVGAFLLKDGYLGAMIGLYRGSFTGLTIGWSYMLALIVLLPHLCVAWVFVLATLLALALSSLSILRARGRLR